MVLEVGGYSYNFVLGLGRRRDVFVENLRVKGRKAILERLVYILVGLELE